MEKTESEKRKKKEGWLKISQQQRTKLESYNMSKFAYLCNIIIFSNSLTSSSGNRHQVGVDLFGIRLFQVHQTTFVRQNKPEAFFFHLTCHYNYEDFPKLNNNDKFTSRAYIPNSHNKMDPKQQDIGTCQYNLYMFNFCLDNLLDYLN